MIRLSTVAGLLVVCVGLSIAPAWGEPAAGPAPSVLEAVDRKPVSFSVKDVPLREACRKLLAGTGVAYATGDASPGSWLAIEPDVPDAPVSLTVRDIGLGLALRLIVRLASSGGQRLELVRRSGGFLIRLAEPRDGELTPVVAGASLANPADARISVDLERVPLRKALEAVFANSGISWTAADGLSQVPITLHVQELRRRSVLLLVLRQVAVEDPRVVLREDPGTGALKIEHEPMWCGFFGIEDVVWEKIPLQYLDARQVTRALGGVDGLAATRRMARHSMVLRDRGYQDPSPPNHFPHIGDFPKPAYPAGRPAIDEALVPDGIRAITAVPADNSLIVSGPPEDLENLKRLLRLLDIPERAIRVRVSFAGAAADAVVLDGHDLRLAATSPAAGFDITVRPSARNSATEVVLAGRLRCGGRVQSFQSTVTVRGVAVRILTISGAGKPQSLWVRLASVK